MKYTVYLRTNKINGKQYVGQSGDFETREKQFKRINQRYANKLLSSDRRKFGLENFELKILAEVETQEMAWKLEKLYIIEYNTKFPNGYNMSDGGETSKGTTHSDDSKNNMRKAALRLWSDDLNGEKRKNASEKAKKVMSGEERRKLQSDKIKEYFKTHPEAIKAASERGKELIGDKNPFFGKHHTEEYKKAKSEQSKGKHYSKNTEFPSKVVYKYDLDMNLLATYPSTAEAARQNGVCQSAITYAALYSKKHMCKGYIYSYEQL